MGAGRERVEAVRAAIASGTYETEAKLDLAIHRMLDALRVGRQESASRTK